MSEAVESFFLLAVESAFLARSVYLNKCTSLLEDPILYHSYRSAPTKNLRLDNGPWLKPTLQAAKQASPTAERIHEGQGGSLCIP